MSNLSRLGSERMAKLAKRPALPPWHRPLSYVLLGAFAVYVGWAALTAPTAPATSQLHGAPASAPAPSQALAPSQAPAPAPVEQDREQRPQDAAGDSVQAPGTIVVPTAQGSSQEVPEAAYQVARAAALALFTGQLEQIPADPQATVPSGLPVYTDPVVSVTVLELAVTGRMVFTTVIDPDGPGPEGPRPVTVSVVESAGRWLFAGFGF
jgi:hypothetical protein